MTNTEQIKQLARQLEEDSALEFKIYQVAWRFNPSYHGRPLESLDNALRALACLPIIPDPYRSSTGDEEPFRYWLKVGTKDLSLFILNTYNEFYETIFENVPIDKAARAICQHIIDRSQKEGLLK